MTRTKPYFVTSAIPYVNAAPHVGFAMELVQADVLARYQRLLGKDVRFLTGTDENSLKNARAAAAIGVPTETLVENNALKFRELRDALDLSWDDFIRTSADLRHRRGVATLWNACAAAGDIYKADYIGLYCVGCEQFVIDAELRDGRCPEHGVLPERIEEENYFFRLSRYANVLTDLIESGTLRIVPASRRNEVLSFLRQPIDDLSISRSRVRALGWGLPVPGDPDQVIYVWFDALANYVTALDFAERAPLYQRYWSSAGDRVHVIGKGVTRFHAVYWPAFLLSAGLPLPSEILVHGYLTVGGSKISKSSANAIDPIELAVRHGVDPLRYFLLRHINTHEDGDFREDGIRAAYDAELANGLGNLLSRTLGLIERFADNTIPTPGASAAVDALLLESARTLRTDVEDAIAEFRLDQALARIWRLVDEANRYVVVAEPWKLARSASHGDRLRLRTVLYNLVETLRIIAISLTPFLPGTAAAITRQLGVEPGTAPSLLDWRRTGPGTRIARSAPLFPKGTGT